MNAYYALMIFHVCSFISVVLHPKWFVYIYIYHICIYLYYLYLYICMYLHGGMYLYLYVLWTANCIVAMHHDYAHTNLMAFSQGQWEPCFSSRNGGVIRCIFWCYKIRGVCLCVCVCVNIPDIETIYYLQNVIYHTWLNILWSHPDVLYNLKDLTGVQWATGC